MLTSVRLLLNTQKASKSNHICLLYYNLNFLIIKYLPQRELQIGIFFFLFFKSNKTSSSLTYTHFQILCVFK